jgi:hypothetical protein
MIDIVTTSFYDDIIYEKQNVHRGLWLKVACEMMKCTVEQVSFKHPSSNEFDDLISVEGRKVDFPLEYKIDYRAYSTGNIAFEIAPIIMEKDMPQEFQNKIRIGAGSFGHSQILDLVEKVNNNQIENAKGSRHFLSNKYYYFCYAISKQGKTDTKSTDDIALYYVFDSRKLSKFIRRNFRQSDIIITKSVNKKHLDTWFTVSMLTNYKSIHFAKICYVFDNSGKRLHNFQQRS